MGVPTFVVGTGRCGSTMLSNMLREHPKVLSLSEFFSNITGPTGDAFIPEWVDGPGFWNILSRIPPFARFCLPHGIRLPEWLYRCDDPEARFPPPTGVPGILQTTLPHLTDHYYPLFDALRCEVAGWPPAWSTEHYKHLFRWLAWRFGKRLWIERSGVTLVWTEQLLAMFPDARFIHIVRDGRDAALSMHGHVAFRLILLMHSIGAYLSVDPFESDDRMHLDRVPAELRPFLPECFDLEEFRAFPIPVTGFAGFWTQQISAAIQGLSRFPEDRLLTIRYEDFFVDPKQQLDTLAAFLGDEYIDEDWSTRCAATVRSPRSSWRDLPKEDAHALTEACRPGFEMLAEMGVHYEF